jgi:hypothetical protein
MSETEQKPKHPGGRPSKYDPAYCQQLIDWMADGGSFDGFAGEIDCGVSTLYDWAGEHKEFSEAKSKGKAKSLALYEKALKECAISGDKDVNPTALMFLLKCRHRAQYNETSNIHLSGADGGAIKTANVTELKGFNTAALMDVINGGSHESRT